MFTTVATALTLAATLNPLAPAMSMLSVQDVPTNYYAALEQCYDLDMQTHDYGDCVMGVDTTFPLSASDFYSGLDFTTPSQDRFFHWLETGEDLGWLAFDPGVTFA